MAGPINPVLDTFIRADSASLGANWTSPLTGRAGTCRIVSNTCRRQASTDSSALWNVNKFAADQEVFATNVANSTGFDGLACRILSATSLADSYYVYISGGAMVIGKFVAGTATDLHSFTQTIANNDSWGMSAVGTTLTAFYKSGAGAWSSLGSITDSSVTGAGYIGISPFGADAGAIAPWGGGSLTSPTNSVAPAATGSTTVGSLLTTTNGTWSENATYTYQWKRNGSPIGGATASTYTLVTADNGAAILCTVTNTNAAGATSADSNAVTDTSGSASNTSFDMSTAWTLLS